MSMNNFNNFNMPSLNGLVDINADTIQSTSIDVNDLSSNVVNTDIIYVNGVDIAQQVQSNAQKLTAITYTATPTPTTIISSDVSIPNAKLDIQGEIYLRDRVYPSTNYIKLSNEIGMYGFVFRLETPNQIMYFQVKDGAGNYRSLQFSYGQMYNQIFFYQDNNFNIAYNKSMFTGDYMALQGGGILYVPVGGAQDGWQFTNYINNFYTNFRNKDTSGNTIQVLRLHYSKITSMIDHEFLGNIIANATTITPTELSYLDNCTGNIQSALNLKSPINNANLTGNTTIITLAVNGSLTVNGSATFNYPIDFYDNLNLKASTAIVVNGTTTISQNELSYLDGVTSSIQTQLSSKASKTGDTFSGAVIFNGTTQMNAAINFNATLTQIGANIAQYTSAVLYQDNSGSTTGTNVLKNTEFFNNITQTGTTASTNKFIQPILTGDVSGGTNTLKYSMIAYDTNSATGTVNPVLSLKDNYNSGSIMFIPNIAAGSYNSINSNGDRSIISMGTQNANSMTVTCWNQKKNGLRVSATSSTNCTTELWADTSSVVLNSTTGVTMTNVTSIGFGGGKTVDGNYGNIYQATLNTTTWTSGVDANVSNALALPAGTYSLHWICTFKVINANVSVTAYAAGVTTSTSGFTDILSRGTLCNTINLNEYFSSTGSTVITFGSAVNIYLRCNCVFATANRIEFNAPASSLRAIKLC